MMEGMTDCHISVRPVKVGSLPRRSDISFSLAMPTATNANAIAVTIIRAILLSFARSPEAYRVTTKYAKRHARVILPVALCVMMIRNADKPTYRRRASLEKTLVAGAYSAANSKNAVIIEHIFFC